MNVDEQDDTALDHTDDWDAAAEVTEPVTSPIALDIHALATADAAMRLNEILTGPTAPKPTISDEPEFTGSSDEAEVEAQEAGPTPEQIAAAEALLARAGRRSVPAASDPDPPVSDRPDPINLRMDEPPAREMQTRIMIGDMEVIGTPERIEYVRKQLGISDEEAAAQRAIPAERAPVPQPMNPVVAAKISAEQEAGRRAAAQQQARAVSHPRNQKTPEEIEAEKPAVTVFRGTGADLQQHLLRRSTKPNTGPGY